MIVWADTDGVSEDYVGATLAAVAVGVASGAGLERGRPGGDLAGSTASGAGGGRVSRRDSVQM